MSPKSSSFWGVLDFWNEGKYYPKVAKSEARLKRHEKKVVEWGAKMREIPIRAGWPKAERKEFEKWVAEFEALFMEVAINQVAIDKQREDWIAKQRLPIAVASTAVPCAVLGAIEGLLWGVLIKAGCSVISVLPLFKGRKLDPEILSRFGGYRPLVQSFVAGPRLEWARNFSVIRGVGPGISCVMKRSRGKDDDALTSLTTGFGTGVVLSLVTGMRGPEVMSVGVTFALMFVRHFKKEEKLAQENSEKDKQENMFFRGLNHHMMNFKTSRRKLAKGLGLDLRVLTIYADGEV